MYNIDINKVTRGVTHSGKFHADDVFSTALLKYLNPDIEFFRAGKIMGVGYKEEDTKIIYDIGMGRFDHHQENSEVRPNGIPYAAFGLLWREFGHYIASEQLVEKFDREFVSHLDYTDNTGILNPISVYISSFMPSYDDDQSPDNVEKHFWKAVDAAKNILRGCFKQLQDEDRAITEVTKALEESDGNIVVLKRFVPFGSVLTPSTAKFVVYPSLRGGYSGKAISSDDGTLKCSFPEEFLDREWVESNTPGITFCHKERFMISGTTVEDVVNACTKAMSM